MTIFRRIKKKSLQERRFELIRQLKQLESEVETIIAKDSSESKLHILKYNSPIPINSIAVADIGSEFRNRSSAE